MDPIVTAGIIAGASALVSSIGSAISRRRAQRRQNQYDSEAMLLQNQLEKHSIAEQNEYNSPANQMKRLQQAGLNPNLVYSMGTVGNQEAKANYGVPEQSYENFFGEGATGVAQSVRQTISDYQALQMSQEQIDAQRIANRLAAAKLPYADQLAYIDARGKEVALKVAEGTYTAQIDTVLEKLNSVKLQNELNKKQQTLLNKRLEEFDKKFALMDDQHKQNLIDYTIKELDRNIKQDNYDYGMEMTRIQGRVLGADSITDINPMDAIKLIIYYAAQHLNIHMPKGKKPVDKGSTKTVEHYDGDGVLRGGSVTTTTPNK